MVEKKACATSGLVLSLFFPHFFMARRGESGYKSIHAGLPKEVSTFRLFLVPYLSQTSLFFARQYSGKVMENEGFQ